MTTEAPTSVDTDISGVIDDIVVTGDSETNDWDEIEREPETDQGYEEYAVDNDDG
jgi:hypothetical protein